MQQQRWVNQIGMVMMGVLITGTVGNGGAVWANDAIETTLEPSTPAMTETTAQAASRLATGQYLWGESQTAEQIGSAYMVFEVVDRNVVGAFYLPHSSFDCFQGELQDDSLNLMVIDSYDRVARPYALAIQQDAYVASNSSVAVPLSIEGFYAIDNLSDNDRRILETCKADFQ